MQILEIYKKYKIAPHLQEHQLRVAAVAWKICESLTIEVDTDTIVITCLLHDLGNILKSKEDPFVPVEQRDYWSHVYDETKEKFGDNPDTATINMIKDLNPKDLKKIMKHMEWIGAHNFLEIHPDDFGALQYIIPVYSDARVAPHGLVSIEERLEEAKNRRKFIEDKSEEIEDVLELIERVIFVKSWLTPKDLDDLSIMPYLEKFKDYDVPIRN